MKKYNWGKGFYIFLIGYLLLFWSVNPSILGVWIGICIVYVLVTATDEPIEINKKPEISAEERKIKNDENYQIILDTFSVSKMNEILMVQKERYGYTPYDMAVFRDKRAKAFYDFWTGEDCEEHLKRFFDYSDEKDLVAFWKLRKNDLIRNRFTDEEKKRLLFKDDRDKEYLSWGIFAMVADEYFKKEGENELKNIPHLSYKGIGGKNLKLSTYINVMFHKYNGIALYCDIDYFYYVYLPNKKIFNNKY